MQINLNGLSGTFAERLVNNNMDARLLRPYVLPDLNIPGGYSNQGYITQTNNMGTEIHVPVHNANASLPYDVWKIIDQTVQDVSLPRLRAYNELRASGGAYTLPNGMAHTVLQTQRMSDITPATIGMNPIRRGEADQVEFDTILFPLPIIWKDFDFTLRDIMASRNGSQPLDMTNVEKASRKVSEDVEKLYLGTNPTFTFGGGTIYGLINFPQRITYDVTAPTEAGWTPAQFIADLLGMRQAAAAKHHHGPFKVYVAPEWDEYLDDDYSAAKGDNTLRDRVAKIDGLSRPITCDYLTPNPASKTWRVILVQHTTDVVRPVIGMDMVTVQWESHGGFQLNFKVMCMLFAQIRADMNGNTGIVHGAPA